MHYGRACGVLLLALTSLCPAPAAPQHAGPQLRVVVTAAETARPLAGARVVVLETGTGGITDAQGEVRLTGLIPGTVTVEARFLGYRTLQLPVELAVTRTASVAISLVAQPIPLAPVEVRPGPDRVRGGARAEFQQRRRRGIGHFITREEIERSRPRRFSDLLRMVPGVRLACVGLMESCGARMASAPPVFAPDLPTRRASRRDPSCPIQYFVDGVYQPYDDVNLIRPEDVEAVEVYSRFSQVPARYARGPNARCGVILIWMRTSLR